MLRIRTYLLTCSLYKKGSGSKIKKIIKCIKRVFYDVLGFSATDRRIIMQYLISTLSGSLSGSGSLNEDESIRTRIRIRNAG